MVSLATPFVSRDLLKLHTFRLYSLFAFSVLSLSHMLQEFLFFQSTIGSDP